MKKEPNTLFRKSYSSQRKNILTRKEISNINAGISDNKRHDAELAKSNFQKYGTGKLISEGTIARLSGIPYPSLDNKTEGDKTSFYYGYYERGNTSIKILIEAGKTSIPILTDNIINGYNEINRIYGLNEEEMPYEELPEELKLSEMLRVIGFNDGKNKEINFEKLNGVIRNCTPYREGFELGRNYLESQNININHNNNKHR